MGFTKGLEKKLPKRPAADSRPALLYPCVPENFDGIPDKTASSSFIGTHQPKTKLLKPAFHLPETRKPAPPKQPHIAEKTLGVKHAAVSETYAKPPRLGLPKAIPVGVAMTPKPGNLVYTPAPSMKDSFGKVKGLPSNTPLPTGTSEKVAAAKKRTRALMGAIKEYPVATNTVQKATQPQMATEPLGASMPNQGTGGGIAGGYGSN